MTELATRSVRCACGQVTRIVYPSTINLAMSGEKALVDLVEGRHGRGTCAGCGAALHVPVRVLVVGPRGAFTVNNEAPPDEIRALVEANGVDLAFVERAARGDAPSYGLAGPPYFRRG